MATQPKLDKMRFTKQMFDKQMGLTMVKAFDRLYHLGVRHAAELDDEGLCRERFDATTNEPGVYGYLTDRRLLNPRRWLLRICDVVGRVAYGNPLYRIVTRMGNVTSTYIGCFLPIAQDFYNKGVMDYLRYGHLSDLTLFDSKSRMWFTDKGLKYQTAWDYKAKIQTFCGNRQEMEIEYMEQYVDVRTSKYQRIGENDARKRCRNPKHYDQFSASIAVITQASI